MFLQDPTTNHLVYLQAIVCTRLDAFMQQGNLTLDIVVDLARRDMKLFTWYVERGITVSSSNSHMYSSTRTHTNVVRTDAVQHELFDLTVQMFSNTGHILLIVSRHPWS